MGVLWIFAHHDFEVMHGLLMLLDHLVSFGTLVDVAEVGGDFLDAAGVREDRFFKFLETTVGQTEMIVDVSLVSHVWLSLERLLHRSDALLVLLEGEKGDALLVEDLRVPVINGKSPLQVIDCELILLHVEVALCSILQELYIVPTSLDRLVEITYGLVIFL